MDFKVDDIVVVISCPTDEKFWGSRFVQHKAFGRLYKLDRGEIARFKNLEHTPLGNNETMINYYPDNIRHATEAEIEMYNQGFSHVIDVDLDLRKAVIRMKIEIGIAGNHEKKSWR